MVSKAKRLHGRNGGFSAIPTMASFTLASSLSSSKTDVGQYQQRRPPLLPPPHPQRVLPAAPPLLLPPHTYTSSSIVKNTIRSTPASSGDLSQPAQIRIGLGVVSRRNYLSSFPPTYFIATTGENRSHAEGMRSHVGTVFGEGGEEKVQVIHGFPE